MQYHSIHRESHRMTCDAVMTINPIFEWSLSYPHFDLLAPRLMKSFPQTGMWQSHARRPFPRYHVASELFRPRPNVFCSILPDSSEARRVAVVRVHDQCQITVRTPNRSRDSNLSCYQDRRQIHRCVWLLDLLRTRTPACLDYAYPTTGPSPGETLNDGRLTRWISKVFFKAGLVVRAIDLDVVF